MLANSKKPLKNAGNIDWWWSSCLNEAVKFIVNFFILDVIWKTTISSRRGNIPTHFILNILWLTEILYKVTLPVSAYPAMDYYPIKGRVVITGYPINLYWVTCDLLPYHPGREVILHFHYTYLVSVSWSDWSSLSPSCFFFGWSPNLFALLAFLSCASFQTVAFKIIRSTNWFISIVFLQKTSRPLMKRVFWLGISHPSCWAVMTTWRNEYQFELYSNYYKWNVWFNQYCHMQSHQKQFWERFPQSGIHASLSY